MTESRAEVIRPQIGNVKLENVKFKLPLCHALKSLIKRRNYLIVRSLPPIFGL